MDASEVRMIGFFFDVRPTDVEDRKVIDRLDNRNVSEQLTDKEHEELFAVYDKYSPNTDEFEHVKRLVETLNDIETMNISFNLVDGSSAFDTEVIIP